MSNPKIVILCLENRSFDEYFGTFPGAINFYDQNGAAIFSQTGFTDNNGLPIASLQPFRMSTFSTSSEWSPGYDHMWADQHLRWNYGAMNGWSVNRAAATQFPGSIGPSGAATMGYFSANDIPYHWTLAQNFLLCDTYFCSVLGSTGPNRLYLMSGTVLDPHQPLPTNSPVFSWETTNIPAITNSGVGSDLPWTSYPGILGPNSSWKIYDDQQWAPPWLAVPGWTQTFPGSSYLPPYLAFSFIKGPPATWALQTADLNILDYLQDYTSVNPIGTSKDTSFRSVTPATAAISNFASDAANQALPDISWILPPYYLSEHPDWLPADGECYLAQVVDAVVTSPYWDQQNIVLIVTYDENDGHFDHVPPPVPLQSQLGTGGLTSLATPLQTQQVNTAAYSGPMFPSMPQQPQMPPAGQAWEPWASTQQSQIQGEDPGVTGPIGAGFRVPTIIVSPWTFNGGLSSQAQPGLIFDHTSVITYLESVTNVHCRNLPMNPPGNWRRQTFSNLGVLINQSNQAASSADVTNGLPSVETVQKWRVDAVYRLFGPNPAPLTESSPSGPAVVLPPPSPTPVQAWPPLQQQCYFIMNKTAFGADEVRGLSEVQNNGNQNGAVTYPTAFWVVVDGFDPAEVGLGPYAATGPDYVAPELNVSLTYNGPAGLITVTPHLTPLPDNSPPAAVPQRFRYTCDINFPQGVSAFSALQVSPNNPVVLNLNASFASRLTWNAPTEQIELVAAADPYIQNGPELTQNVDLRVFTIPADGQTTFFGQTIDPTNPDPIGTIQQALSTLNGAPSMWPAAPDPTNAQQEEAVSTVTVYPTLNGGTTVSASNPLVFCFGIVRVTLQGVTELADNVRVFFRLVPAANTGVSYDQTTLYRSTPLPGAGQPNPSGSTADTVTTPNPNTPSPPPNPPWQTRVPLLGLGPPHPPPLRIRDILTIPFFAIPRIDATQSPMYTQPPDWPNTQRITPNQNGEPVYAFFGCWLDINVDPTSTAQGSIVGADTQMFPPVAAEGTLSKFDGPYGVGPYQPISAFVKSQHQCIIAEVAYDPLPIPPGAIPGENQQLAQRNLFVIGGTN
jgi:phospholipase C